MMKRNFLRIAVFSLLVALSAEASAQPRRPPGNQPTPTPETPTTNNGTPQPNPTPVPANIPIVFDTSASGSGLGGVSLRDYNAFDKSGLNDRTPLPYDHIRWDDAMYAEMVWRELDFREKMNQVFQYEGIEGGDSQMFIDMLLEAVNKGEVMAFRDDAFTIPMESSDLALLTAGGFDTTKRFDLIDPSKVTELVVTRKVFDSKSVSKLMIREQWIVDREAGRMVCRILGMAPIQTLYDDNGNEKGLTQMFWVYYPDLRATLVKKEVYNPRNMGASRMTWEELFESRMFSSYITKSTINNPGNRTIRNMIKDPILALLEGDNIKEKIFTFEQNLWEY